jgi:excisionase family DNA binding protein
MSPTPTGGTMATLLLKPEEAAAELRIGRTRMYDLIRRREIISIKVEGSRRVPRTALDAYVNRLISEQSVASQEAT